MNAECRMRSAEFDRSGFSLLEVLLALALTVVIFSAIASAIHVNLVAMGKQQAKIEQRQIARNLLEIIGNDLRAAIQYKAADYSGLENLAATQQQAIQNAAAAAAAPVAAIGTGAAATGDEEPEPVIDEEAVAYRPKLTGTGVALAVDVSRLPRLDQYFNPTVVGGQISSTPSDIKSVSYFFSNANIEEAVFAKTDTRSPGGLYRRELDRAIASFRSDVSLRSTPDEYCRLVAPEVASIEFQYFDGTDWQASWNSEEQEAFPVAVEIRVTLDPLRTSANSTDPDMGSLSTLHRLVVHLPIAEPSGAGTE